MSRLSRDTESVSVLQERHARLPNATLGVVASGTQPVAEAVYPSGERRPFTWDLKAALEFAKSAAGEFCVGPSGEHAFDRSKVEARLKEKGQEKTEKRARRKPARS